MAIELRRAPTAVKGWGRRAEFLLKRTHSECVMDTSGLESKLGLMVPESHHGMKHGVGKQAYISWNIHLICKCGAERELTGNDLGF